MMKRLTVVALTTLLLFGSRVLLADEVQGRVGWDAPLTLSTKLAAEVMKSSIAVGEEVKKGTVLLQLESGVATAQLRHAQAELTYRKLLRDEAQKELARSEELYDRTLLADHDLDLARIAHASAQSDYRRAQAELKARKRDVALRRIVAPFDVRVVERHARAGETVNGQYKTAPLVSVVATATRRVKLDVEQAMLSRLSIGSKLDVSVGGQRYSASVAEITSRRDKSLKEYAIVELIFSADARGHPKVGQSATVLLP